MAQDILITPKAATPTIAYTGNGGGAATITQKVLSTSIMQFDDGGAVLFEMDPVANTVSALNLETNNLTMGTGGTIDNVYSLSGTFVSATQFFGNGANLTGVVAEWDGSHTGNATINGNLDITGNVNVTGNTILDAVTGTGLTVQGNAGVTGTLNVTGNTTLAAVTGTNMRANGTLTVTGNTTLAAVTGTNATFDAIVGDSLSVTGNVSANAFYGDGSNLTNIAAGTISHGSLSGLTTGDDHTQYIYNTPGNGTRNVITAGSAQALTIKGPAVPVSDQQMFLIETNAGVDVFVVDVEGDVTGAAARFNSAQVTGTLNVTGNTTLAAVTGTNIRANGTMQVTGTLNVTGNTTLAAVTGTNMRANGTLTVTGNTTLAAVTATNTQVNGTLTVTGNSVLEDVTATGAFNLSGNMLGDGDIQIAGDLKAASKSFLIEHPDPAKPGWQLQYTCLEGPENGVYTRGRANGLVVDLPDYWPHLVHQDSITVHLTPIGLSHPIVRVSDVKDNKIFVEGAGPDDIIDFFYIAYATRKDIPLLVVEHEPAEEGK